VRIAPIPATSPYGRQYASAAVREPLDPALTNNPKLRYQNKCTKTSNVPQCEL